MKVYIILNINYDFTSIVAVFNTLEKAEAFVSNQTDKLYRSCLEIEAYEVL